MIKQYLIVAWRYLKRHRSYVMINVAGLAVGLTVSLVLILHVLDEVYYNRTVAVSGDVYQAVYKVGLNQSNYAFGQTSQSLRPFLPTGNGDVLELASKRLPAQPQDDVIVSASEEYQHFFPLTVLEGDPGQVWKKQGAVILTSSQAKKRLDKAPYAGRRFEYYGKIYEVAAVVKAQPGNSMVYFDILGGPDSGLPAAAYHYTFYKPHQAKAAEQQVPHFSSMPDIPGVQHMGVSCAVSLVPFTDIYRHHQVIGNPSGMWQGLPLHVLWLLALLVVVLVTGNYAAMSSVKNRGRLREAGLRKLLGASPLQVAGQFMAESLMLVTLAVIMALIITDQLLPYFNDLTGKLLSLRGEWAGYEWAGVLCLAVITLVGAICIPAIQLASTATLADLGRLKVPSISFVMLRRWWAGAQVGIFWVLLFLSLITAHYSTRMQGQSAALWQQPNESVTTPYDKKQLKAVAAAGIDPASLKTPEEAAEARTTVPYIDGQLVKKKMIPSFKTDISGILACMAVAWAIICMWAVLGLASFDKVFEQKPNLIKRLMGAEPGGLVLHAQKRYIYMTSMAILLMLPFAYAGIQYWLMEVYFVHAPSHIQPEAPWWIWLVSILANLMIVTIIPILSMSPAGRLRLSWLNRE